MGDGAGDCASQCEQVANDFVKRNYPKLREINHSTHAPENGTVLLMYEEGLRTNHNIEIIKDRKLIKRYVAGLEDVKERPITQEDWQIGFYE